MLSRVEEEDWQQRLIVAGWEQGSVFAPSDTILKLLPDFLSFQSEQFLVVCTQTCSLLSGNLDKEPVVEVLLADPLEAYDPNASRARGKEVNNFHLPFASGSLIKDRFSAINCCLSKRFFFPRKLLLEVNPIPVELTNSALKSFKGWIANYYSRVAMPGCLVSRMEMGKKKSFNSDITKVLKEKADSGNIFHENVRAFYISWDPNKEQERSQDLYNIRIIVVCDILEIEWQLEEKLNEKLDLYINGSNGKNGIVLSEILVRYMDNVSLLDIDGMFRFGRLDELSTLDQRPESRPLE